MSIPTPTYLLNFSVALTAFIVHIVLNFSLTKPNPALDALLQNYRLSPPPWVFTIWLIIWVMQAILFYKTYHTSFWSSRTTILFVLICLGNVGSQFAGANNLSWQIYISCLLCMLIAAVLLMKRAEDFSQSSAIIKYATQIYVGWASIAFVVGSGMILIYIWQIIGSAQYTNLGYILLVLVPIIIWYFWFRGSADYRGITFPYFWVLTSFLIRFIIK